MKTLLGRIAAFTVTTLLLIQMAHAAVFQVQGVANWDSLNIRSKPGAKNKIVGKIPANGKYIRTSGKRVAIGRTVWINITWQGKNGWVSERYIRPMPTTPPPQATQPRPTPAAPIVTPTTGNPAVAPPSKPIPRTRKVPGSKGKWVLECGNVSPFWRIIVHPKALDVNLRGQAVGMLPITYEKQDRNRWNTAMKTVLKSSNGRAGANMTIRYTKQCFHTLTKQKVHYRVKALIKGETMNGCCRAVRIQ
ncbi:MAG: hypothetical protein CSB47_00230 [Proteobacteria bacterium]|nr:MAG: hypothetical protein CSB47_00230 [Pseudomonadota bacterium]